MEYAMSDKAKMVSTYLDANTLAKVVALAKADQRSISNVVSVAILEYISQPAQVRKWHPNAPKFSPTAEKLFAEFESAKFSNRQVDLEDAIVEAVKAGPTTTAEKQAKSRKNMDARAARMADRMSNRK
jgi:hypothetical protein